MGGVKGRTVLHMLVEQDFSKRKPKHSSFSTAILSQCERSSRENHLLIAFLVYFPLLWFYVGI